MDGWTPEPQHECLYRMVPCDFGRSQELQVRNYRLCDSGRALTVGQAELHVHYLTATLVQVVEDAVDGS